MAANPLSEVNDLAVQIAQHEAAIGALKADRSKAIFALLMAGYSEREIALAAGLSGPRINQIKKEAHSG